MRSIRLLLCLLAFAAALVLTPSCEGDAPSAGTDALVTEPGAEPGATLRAAVWSLRWDLSRVTRLRGGGLLITNDLGFTVHVEEGWVTNHLVSFGPCEVKSGESDQTSLFHVRSARAHSDNDASAIELMHADSLASPEGSALYPSAFPRTRYCRAFWLAARATKPSDAPDGVDLSQTSLRVQGTWRRKGMGNAEGAIDVDTWWPGSALVDLDDAMSRAARQLAAQEDSVWVAHVTVTRRLGELFDGIDFEADSDEEIQGRLIENLGSAVDVEVLLTA